jgi:hypothetical protein
MYEGPEGHAHAEHIATSRNHKLLKLFGPIRRKRLALPIGERFDLLFCKGFLRFEALDKKLEDLPLILGPAFLRLGCHPPSYRPPLLPLATNDSSVTIEILPDNLR